MARPWRAVETFYKGDWVPRQGIVDDIFLCGKKGCNRKITKHTHKILPAKIGTGFCSPSHYYDYLRINGKKKGEL